MYTKITKPSHTDHSVIHHNPVHHNPVHHNAEPVVKTQVKMTAATHTQTGSMASVIRKDIKVTGDVICSGDVQLDGLVEGNLQSRSATISEGAHVHGSVSAETVRILGSVTGQIRGNTVTLAKTARVVGDILHQSLAIEPGAYIDGQCRPMAMGDQKVSVGREKTNHQGVNGLSNGIPSSTPAASVRIPR
ncbi:MAG: polymer-forming cytoskeletal protein [Alphaproteobacteria bacterium]|nr:polymer-forming cytoskeletal protein [Alphaproteobacteria bacterium]